MEQTFVAKAMNGPNVLVPDDLDLVDEPELTEIVPELLFSDELVERAEVDGRDVVEMRWGRL